jgi:hypothetical protein
MRYLKSIPVLSVFSLFLLIVFVSVSGCSTPTKAITVHLNVYADLQPPTITSLVPPPDSSVYFISVKNGLNGMWLEDKHLEVKTGGANGEAAFHVDYQLTDGEIIFFAASNNLTRLNNDFYYKAMTDANAQMGLWQPVMYDVVKAKAGQYSDCTIDRHLSINYTSGLMWAMD